MTPTDGLDVTVSKGSDGLRRYSFVRYSNVNIQSIIGILQCIYPFRRRGGAQSLFITPSAVFFLATRYTALTLPSITQA